ncbi:peptidase C65 Otubain-domain-containing protein [Lipomyces japonicus]|uniref:peptidase C65 Otubain-domain-containing protein n=1 Tax=Lipomyces japonicus TaxID=56871 RepID=UPI0034CE8201
MTKEEQTRIKNGELDDVTILRLTQEIKDVEASKTPLVGEFRPLKALLDEYVDSNFRNKITALNVGNAGYRPVRGDGNCAWRAFAFRYFEILSTATPAELDAELNHLKAKNELLDAAGYQETAYADFVDETVNLLTRLPALTRADELVTEFNKQEVSSAIVVHLRLLSAAFVKTHAADYEFFIDGGTTVDDYCSRNIEAFAVEADHVALSALVNALESVELDVVYVDRSEGEQAVVHSFSPAYANSNATAARRQVALLYRPGHYDVFYK